MTTGSDSHAPTLPPKFVRVMDACQQLVLSHLTPLLKQAFENSDVALLDFADKAESNAAQAEFFDAMKEVARKQSLAERVFFEEVKRGFHNFPFSPANGGGQLGEVKADQLSLVDTDEFEEELPVRNMTSKATATYIQELYGLNQRLAIINRGTKPGDDAIPGGPAHLANAFRQAAREFEFPRKIKFILYALFDKYVMTQLQPMYEAYNQQLVEAGLLPHLRYEIRKHYDPRLAGSGRRPAAPADKPAQGAAQQPAAEADAGGGSVGAELFENIRELLSTRRQHMGGEEAEVVPMTEAEVVQSRANLVAAINTVQSEQAAENGNSFSEQFIQDVEIDEQLLSKIKDTLTEERKKVYRGVDRRRIPTADRDVIDLVGMLFEYMLDHEELPNAVKALLSRLHTPFLKVAIIDKRLFTRTKHPARRLLDAMVDAGIKYVSEDELDRGIFPQMKATVDRVMSEFTDDLDLFEELLEEFNIKVADLQNKAQLIEKRAIEAARGQARLAESRLRANREIAQRLEGTSLPLRVVNFLRQRMAEKLMFILLRERDGDQSDAWRVALRIVDDVIWSTDPDTVRNERATLESRLPLLRDEIRAGLEKLKAYGRHEVEESMALILDCQEAALASDGVAEEMVSVSAEAPPPAEVAGAAVERATEPQGEDAVAEAGKALDAELEEISDEERAMQEQLGQVEFGTWFEFRGPAGTRPRRLKLAWFSRITGKYMFVDQIGVKAAEVPLKTLAREMCQGRVRFVAQHKKPFIDRALEAVSGFLRKSVGGGVAEPAAT